MCAHSIAHQMGHEPALHCTTACGEGLLAEPREQEGRMQDNLQCVNDEPLLMLLKDVMEQRFVDHCQLARQAW